MKYIISERPHIYNLNCGPIKVYGINSNWWGKKNCTTSMITFRVKGIKCDEQPADCYMVGQ